MDIIPAILPKTRDELISKLSLLRDAGYTGRIQIDMCDGNYVDASTWPFDNDPATIQSSITLTSMIITDPELKELLSHFEIDLDLMVSSATDTMILWNAFLPKRIVIHVDTLKKEDIEHLTALLSEDETLFEVMREKSVVFGFSLDTEIEKFAYWYDNFYMRSVQVMGIERVGHQGQEFSERAIDYIESLKDRYPDISIMVDGGVSLDTINRLNQIGVAEVIVGSAAFKNNDIMKNLEELAARAIL